MISSIPLIFLYDVTDVVGKAVGKVHILGRFQIGDVEMAKVSPSLVERNLGPNSFCGCESIKHGNSASIRHLETQQIANTDGQSQGWQSVNHFPRIDRPLRRNSRSSTRSSDFSEPTLSSQKSVNA